MNQLPTGTYQYRTVNGHLVTVIIHDYSADGLVATVSYPAAEDKQPMLLLTSELNDLTPVTH